MRDHGGNIYEKCRENGFAPGGIIDFSASINPKGMSRAATAAIKEHISFVPHYPEPYSESLVTVIAEHYRINPGSVICGNGSTELIYLLPKALKPKRVLITAPAFSEYEKACSVYSRASVVRFVLRREDNFTVDPDAFINTMAGTGPGKGRKCDLAFLCNPHNPTGMLLKKHDILKIADAARKLRSYFVVDEAFIDFCPGESIMSAVAGNPYLIVLRSMTKFYALAGLRLGFAVFPAKVAEHVKRYKEPWSVNNLALAAGKVLLSDDAYRDASLALIEREKRYLETCLKQSGISYWPSAANYFLLYFRNSGAIAAKLEKKGILVRDCSNFKGLGKGYIRIAVRSRRENELLMKELARICAA
jgi:threonine-phosphate decarboxylase